MTHQRNQAAIDYWNAMDRRIDAALRQKVQESLGDGRYVDLWVDQMVQNSIDTMPEDVMTSIHYEVPLLLQYSE